MTDQGAEMARMIDKTGKIGYYCVVKAYFLKKQRGEAYGAS